MENVGLADRWCRRRSPAYSSPERHSPWTRVPAAQHRDGRSLCIGLAVRRHTSARGPVGVVDHGQGQWVLCLRHLRFHLGEKRRIVACGNRKSPNRGEENPQVISRPHGRLHFFIPTFRCYFAHGRLPAHQDSQLVLLSASPASFEGAIEISLDKPDLAALVVVTAHSLSPDDLAPLSEPTSGGSSSRFGSTAKVRELP